ncbi:ABC transporter ATP-binding protein [Halorubellus sp. JP-L1]|uniref:ABC transporter ATP-binding protein n=1 Tax=Halorubellus sp. JP-L1 TaxID=2715753 RepID=UPI00140976C7|nr:ABC transporter ATP-binding protein [Halorubellus sp. JP-L1]NHN42997.1 ABC transporter ATP-binding protein [Halorubellus sp. JP-L1]
MSTDDAATNDVLREDRDVKISIDSVDKIYGMDTDAPTQALKDIDLEIHDDEFVSIIGPSGCGKTTLLKCLADIIPQTAGEIHVSGKTAEEARKNNDISFFFQEDVLLPWRTVMENVLLPFEVKGTSTPKEEARERAEKMLDTVGLAGFEDHQPQELSGGMRQRVALARGFVYNPEIFLMDEPFAALDELTRRKMNQELLRIHQEIQKTTVFVTHHISEAVWLSDRIVVLSPRPGEVHEVVDVDIPRPRDESTRHTDKFDELEEYLTKTVMELDV